MKSSPYVRIWEFCVKARREKMFEQIYGPEGDWVQLFSKGRGYLRTYFLRDVKARGRYLTIDYWTSEQSYETFRRKFDDEFLALDRKCELLTESEASLGSFHGVAPH